MKAHIRLFSFFTFNWSTESANFPGGTAGRPFRCSTAKTLIKLGEHMLAYAVGTASDAFDLPIAIIHCIKCQTVRLKWYKIFFSFLNCKLSRCDCSNRLTWFYIHLSLSLSLSLKSCFFMSQLAFFKGDSAIIRKEPLNRASSLGDRSLSWKGIAERVWTPRLLDQKMLLREPSLMAMVSSGNLFRRSNISHSLSSFVRSTPTNHSVYWYTGLPIEPDATNSESTNDDRPVQRWKL